MKTPSTTLIALWSSLALVLAAAIWLPAQSPAAEPENVKPMTEEKMKGCCGTMKTQMGKMKTDVKAQDDELTEQVAKMNGAPDDKKLTMMAAVITRMAEDRVVMNANMDVLHMAMRQHIMQHMSMSKESIAGCSMMKGTDEKSTDAEKTPK
jgi:hypothetical protein